MNAIAGGTLVFNNTCSKSDGERKYTPSAVQKIGGLDGGT